VAERQAQYDEAVVNRDAAEADLAAARAALAECEAGS